MSEDEELKAGLLDFLTDNIFGRERDAVNRAFYEYAEGDPHSHPVALAVILIACARQIAGLPKKTRDSVEELETLAGRVAQVEKDLLEKLARENLSTHSAIKLEAAQLLEHLRIELSRGVASITSGSRDSKAAWEEVFKVFNTALNQGQRIALDLKPIVESAEQIARDFRAIKGDLKFRDESDKRTFDAVASLKSIHEESRAIHKQSQASHQAVLNIVDSATKDGRSHWSVIGLITGLVLANTASQLPWWGNWLSFAAAIILLQWISSAKRLF